MRIPDIKEINFFVIMFKIIDNFLAIYSVFNIDKNFDYKILQFYASFKHIVLY